MLLNSIINKDIYTLNESHENNSIQKLFNIFDKDKDGYIGTLDTLYIIELCEKYILILEHNFIDNIVHELIINKKINFEAFSKIYSGS